MPHPTKLPNSGSNANTNTNTNSNSNSNSNSNPAASPVIKVGSTGTVASLMSRELDTIKITQITPQETAANASSSSSSSAINNPRKKKYQSRPVSVPCGANPRKTLHPKKGNLSKEEGDNKMAKSVRKNGCDAPMLRGDNVGITDGNLNLNLKPNTVKNGKKGVEVVDLKCNNPMSSRLRKLGFSKLSETYAG